MKKKLSMTKRAKMLRKMRRTETQRARYLRLLIKRLQLQRYEARMRGQFGYSYSYGSARMLDKQIDALSAAYTTLSKRQKGLI